MFLVTPCTGTRHTNAGTLLYMSMNVRMRVRNLAISLSFNDSKNRLLNQDNPDRRSGKGKPGNQT